MDTAHTRLTSKPSQPKPPRSRKIAVTPASKRRLWFFRLAVLVLPLALFGILEVCLRLGGYGYEPALFKPMKIGNVDYLVQNDDFSLRFFPPQTARYPGPFRMLAHKPPGTFRIFILGESAAMGDPKPAYGPGRYLEVLLQEKYPSAKFEIINVAFTAINSHVILPIARDCARQDGDLWIIYMGNNEMVGPFGAATVFGAKAPPVEIVRLNLAIQKMRSGQLLMNIVSKLKGGGGSPPSWAGMEMFVGNQLSTADSRKEVVYHNFSVNLHDIVKAGLASGTKILLNTVAVNLKDCAPFASLENSNLSAGDRIEFQQLFSAGVHAGDKGNFTGAAQEFEPAARLDPTCAELQFRWGQSLLKLTNYAAAHEHLQLACDDDALPFRADSRINSIIRNEQKTSGSNLVLFDAANALAAGTTENICGRETFFEHVHFNFDGDYCLGRAWAQQVAAMLPATITNQAAGDWAEQEACERWLGLSDWNRSLVIQNVAGRMQQPPLSGQLDNASRVEALQDRLKQLHLRTSPVNAGKTRDAFRQSLERAPDDYYLHENFSLFLESTGDLPGAVAECHQVHGLIPQDCVVHFLLGRLLKMQGQYADAESSFREAVRIRPSLTDGWVQLGDTLALEGKFEDATASYVIALKQRPWDSETIFEYGKVLAKLNHHAEAIEHYHEAIKLNPADWEPHYQLAGELDSENLLPEACNEFGEAARLNPNYSRAHFNYGVTLAKQARLDEAQREFSDALRLEPGYKNAKDALMQMQSLRNPAQKN